VGGVKAKAQKGVGLGIGFLFFVGMTVFMVYIFGFSVKYTDEYACVMEQVRRSEVVRRQLGQPIEPARIAWLYQRETGGSRASTTFGTNISGPRGRGQIRADTYLAPVGSYLLLQLKTGEGWLDLYNGDYPCR
jgi:hypothetical protein